LPPWENATALFSAAPVARSHSLTDLLYILIRSCPPSTETRNLFLCSIIVSILSSIGIKSFYLDRCTSSNTSFVIPSVLPSRLLGHTKGNFEVFDPRDPAYRVNYLCIISYTWGVKTQPYNCGIDGVNWNGKISKEKLEDIKRLIIKDNVQYLWVDCVCLNRDDEKRCPLRYLRYTSTTRAPASATF
jgi:hypothetical protein